MPTIKSILVFVFVFNTVFYSFPTFSASLEEDVVWSGVVTIDEDLLVPAGVKLTILPGTRILFNPAPTTRTDPVFFNPANEIAINGELVAVGSKTQPIVFDGPLEWGGLYAAPGGKATLDNVEIVNASEGFACIGAECSLLNVSVKKGDYGIILGPGAKLKAESASIVGCRVGIYDAREEPTKPEGIILDGVKDASYLAAAPGGKQVYALDASVLSKKKIEHIGEYSVEMDETWDGHIIFSGRVTVVPGAVLTILPGTRISFRKIDTNNDGLGEGELLVLGGIRSMGTHENPIIFESAEPEPKPGDWDKLSLIDSEDPYNLFKYTIFRHGVQTLHAHFAEFTASDCLFEQNIRAVQFQDCNKVKIENSVFINNRQGLRFRDSNVKALGNVFFSNLYAVHAFRCELDFHGNILDSNLLGGFLSKESNVGFSNNRLANSRDGARMKGDGSSAKIFGNSFFNLAEDALSLSFVQGSVDGNSFSASGLDLVSLEDSQIVLRNNIFSDSTRHHLHLKGESDVDAAGNFWGKEDPSDKIYDKNDDSGLGKATIKPILKKKPELDFVSSGTW